VRARVTGAHSPWAWPVPARQWHQCPRVLGLLRVSGRMLTNERTNQQTRRIAIPPGGGNKVIIILGKIIENVKEGWLYNSEFHIVPQNILLHPHICNVKYTWLVRASNKSNHHHPTRKLCYRKDDRAMRPTYGCPENFLDSLTSLRPLFPTFSWVFVPIDPMNVPTKFEVRSFTRSWDNTGYPKIWALPGYAHAPFSPKF